METIFDHDVTEEEIRHFLIRDPSEVNKVEWEKELETITSQDANFAMIANLYAMRGNLKKADEYIGWIKDEGFRREEQYIINTTYRMPPGFIA